MTGFYIGLIGALIGILLYEICLAIVRYYTRNWWR